MALRTIVKQTDSYNRMTITFSKGNQKFKVSASRSGFRYSGQGQTTETFNKQQAKASKILNGSRGTLETKFKKLAKTRIF